MQTKLKDEIIRLLQEGKADEIVKIGISAIPLLINALKDENSDVRWRAAWAIGKIAEANPGSKKVLKAVPDLIVALKDENSNVRESAAWAIGKIAEANPDSKEVLKAVPALIAALKDKDQYVQYEAAWAIGKIGVNDEQFETIVRMLKEGETEGERHGAAMALGELKNVKAVPDLIVALKDENSDVRWRAAWAIGKIAEANPGSKEVLKAVPDLIAALKDENWDARCEAAEALEKIGFDKVPEEKRMEVKVLALLILGKTDDAAAIGEPAVPYLITALKDKDSNVRERAAEAIGKIAEANPDSKEVLKAVPALIAALKDKDQYVRERAAEAIGKIGVNDEQFETIVRMLKEGETKEEREGAAMALGELKNVKAVPDLIVALKDKDSDVRKSAAEAIGKIAEANPGSKEVLKAVPDLIAALKDKDWNVRKRAAEALEKIGFDKVPEEKRMEVKVLALLILGKTDDAAAIGEPTVPYLMTALKNEYWSVRERAAEAIKKIIEKLIEKGEFGEALETIRSTTTTIMNFYKDAFRTARKKNKTMGKDRILLKQREELLKKLEFLTNEVYTRVKEKEGLPNPLNEKEPMEWKRVERTEKDDTVRRGSLRHS